MKRYLLVTLIAGFSLSAPAQDKYWQQHLAYTIDARLDASAKTVTGNETIVYTNNSPSKLDFIWFHIWPNAYKDKSTALFRQIETDTSRKKKLTDIKYGDISGLTFKSNGVALATEAHSNPQFIDIIKVKLPSALQPGGSVTINVTFTVKLPSYFSRSGYADGQFMVTQWYPKPAVFDKNGWHEFPYLDMGEFYSEYADYNVKITVPGDMVVGATGQLQTASELEQYKRIGAKNTADTTGKPALYNAGGVKVKTLEYVAKNVPDFAWFADKDFVVQYDTLKLASGKVVDAFSYYHNKPVTLWKASIGYVKDAVRYYSQIIGEYEYPTVQAVEGPANNSSGGMEYPMITLITSPDAKKETLDAVIAHEVGHNWFMSMLGSNERAHTWMDEGLNTYIQFRYEADKYRRNSIVGDDIPAFLKELSAKDFLDRIYGALLTVPMTAAMETPSDQFKTSEEYGMVSYVKTAIWMYLLEASFGKDKVDDALKNYFNLWHDKHPQPEDMKTAFEQAIGKNLDNFFELTKKEGKLIDQQ